MSTAQDIRDQRQGILAKIGRGVTLGRVADIEQVLWSAQLFGFGWLGRADIHAAINRGGVHIDDFNGPTVRQGCGTGAFAGGRGACQRQYGRDHWPRMNRLSNSASGNWTQVGRSSVE